MGFFPKFSDLYGTINETSPVSIGNLFFKIGTVAVVFVVAVMSFAIPAAFCMRLVSMFPVIARIMPVLLLGLMIFGIFGFGVMAFVSPFILLAVGNIRSRHEFTHEFTQALGASCICFFVGYVLLQYSSRVFSAVGM